MTRRRRDASRGMLDFEFAISRAKLDTPNRSPLQFQNHKKQPTLTNKDLFPLHAALAFYC